MGNGVISGLTNDRLYYFVDNVFLMGANLSLMNINHEGVTEPSKVQVSNLVACFGQKGIKLDVMLLSQTFLSVHYLRFMKCLDTK